MPCLFASLVSSQANHSFQSVFQKHLDFVLLSPHSMNSRITLFIVALFFSIVILSKCQISFNAERGNLLMGLFSGLLVPLLVLSGSTAFECYLYPRIPTTTLAEYAPAMVVSQTTKPATSLSKEQNTRLKAFFSIIAGILVFLFIGGPLTQFFFRSGFLATLFSWILALFVSACIMGAVQLFVFHEEIWDELPLLKQMPRDFEKIIEKTQDSP